MYSMNGFANIHPWVSNLTGIVAPVGEASPKALTTSREVGYHTKPAFSNVTLMVFESTRDNVATVAEITIVDKLLEITSFLYTRSINGALSDDLPGCLQLLQAEFGGAVNFSRVGKMVFTGAYWFPESITAEFPNLGEDNQVRLWFSDTAFRSECDVHEIIPVVPVADLNLLHGSRASVTALLASMTPDYYTTQIQLVTANRSQTTIVSKIYDWTDPVDPSITIPSYFTAIIYGGAGNNEDLIRQAFIDYLLANSDYTTEQWEVIYPDLFKPLEYFITPTWDNYSLGNLTPEAGVYSPDVMFNKIMDYGRDSFFQQPDSHIAEWSSVVGTIYKSLPFVALGNFKNRRNLFGFKQLWPKYAAIPTTSYDFNRIPETTQQFIMHLVEHLKYAEEVTPTGDIPSGYSLTQRGGHYYLVKTFDKVVYLVWIKWNGFPTEPVPEIPAADDFTLVLTRNYNEETQAQSISAILRKVGDPSPYDPAVVVDWSLAGDWCNRQIQDSNSTQLIDVVITSSETGSATHSVSAEFVVSGVPLTVTGNIDLLPLVSESVDYSLTATYNDDTSVRLQLKLGEQLVNVAAELEGGIVFTATAIDVERITETLHSDFLIEVQNQQMTFDDGSTHIEYTFTATFTPLGGDEITLTVTTADVLTQPTIDQTFDVSFELADPETARFYLRDSEDNPITLPGASYFEVCMLGSGNKHLDLSTDGDILIPLTFTEEIVIIRYGYTQLGVTKRRAHVMHVNMGQAEA